MNKVIVNCYANTREFLLKPKVLVVMQVMLAICLLGLSGYVFASDGDILKGTDSSLMSTLQGSGKKYIYLAEGFLSLAMYIKTKNLLVLFGIIVVAAFFNIIIKVATSVSV